MGKSHPNHIREDVVAMVEAGSTLAEAAQKHGVSHVFVHRMVALKKKNGSIEPKAQGRTDGGKLVEHETWIRAKLIENPYLTASELGTLLQKKGVNLDPSQISRFLRQKGLNRKNRKFPPKEREQANLSPSAS